MKAVELNYENGFDAVNNVLAKSSAYKGKWINRVSGEYLDIDKAITKASFDIHVYFGMNDTAVITEGKTQVFLDILRTLDPIKDTDLININKFNKKFDFFNRHLAATPGVKKSVRELHEAYKKSINPKRGITGFTYDLKAWANETGYQMRFFNMRINRKVVVYA